MAKSQSEKGTVVSSVSRRDFLKSAGAGSVLTAATAGTVLFHESKAYAQQRWDHEADVVVVGGGAAGGAAAVFALAGGAQVIMLEKAPSVGGTSARSGGVYWIPNNRLMRAKGIADSRDDCLRYMARCSYPMLYSANDPTLGVGANKYALLEAFYDNGAATIDALQEMGALESMLSTRALSSAQDVDIEAATEGDLWPDYYAQLPEDKAPRGRSLVVKPRGNRGEGGSEMIRQLHESVEQRGGQILVDHRATRLVVNGSNEVVGVEATTDSGRTTVAVRARKGVVFGSGGFTHNPEMCLNHLRGPIFGGCAAPTNEGDFVHIGTAAGASLGNMTNAWWWPVMLEPALQSRDTRGFTQLPGDSMIQVNRFGHRVVNEKIQYNERTQAHFAWDPSRGEYPNLVLFMIYDEFTRERFGGTSAAIPSSGVTAPFVLEGQTLEELASRIDARLSELADRTGNVRLDSGFVTGLKQSIATFNGYAETGKDTEFLRGEGPIETWFHGDRRPDNDKPNPTMYPISATGPYYAVMFCAGTLDTKGGPVINAKAQVLDRHERPIPGLFGAGNCIASPAAQTYFAAGGTLGLALTFGAIAGKSAVAESVKATD